MTRKEIENLVMTGVFGGLGLVLPVLFHLTGLGAAFLPMFVPYAVASCTLSLGGICFLGCVVPVLSFLLTGMPPVVPPILFLMVFEGLALGISLWFLFQKRRWNIWVSVAAGLCFFTLAKIVFISVIAPVFGFSEMLMTIMSLAHSLPGYVLILITVPVSVRFVKKHTNTY